jgi:biopolymer transport protein ExbD
VDIPDEQRISIQESGQIVLNDLTVDSPQSRELPALLKTLTRFKESADANKSTALITIDAADRCDHQRIVDVLNVCAQAGIQGVTFSATAEEE